MKSVQTLPEGYREIYAIDLQKDKKLALLVNLLSLGIAAALILPMLAVVPIGTTFVLRGDLSEYWTKLGVMLASMIVYMILHELTHGVAMKLYGTKKVKYGFTGLYAFAKSDDYYSKKPYIVIALAPVVVWGIVLVIVNALVPYTWFWVVYAVQVCNLCGAAGDYYVTVRFSRFPRDVLIRDHGTGMAVYSKE